jgi:uncharacterized protein (DUF1786 family)
MAIGRILAIDIGAGTQDVLIYDPDLGPENCLKMVLPSMTQIIGSRVRTATAQCRPIHLDGSLMGGGASSDAIKDHIAARLTVTATPNAARTIHNDLDKVAAMGIQLTDGAAPHAAEVITLGDVDIGALQSALTAFEVSLPDTVALAVQDHGYLPGRGNNDLRFEYLNQLIDEGGDLTRMVFQTPPAAMSRMAAVAALVPGTYLMDTGAAAVLGVLGDPIVARAVHDEGAILVNVGNMHTFAVLVRGTRLFGLFEHHTGGISPTIVAELVGRLQQGTITNQEFRREFDGHGAALDPAYHEHGPFHFVAVTGPNRHLVRELGYHEAAPFGDIMLSGAFGLVEGVLRREKGHGIAA